MESKTEGEGDGSDPASCLICPLLGLSRGLRLEDASHNSHSFSPIQVQDDAYSFSNHLSSSTSQFHVGPACFRIAGVLLPIHTQPNLWLQLPCKPPGPTKDCRGPYGWKALVLELLPGACMVLVYPQQCIVKCSVADTQNCFVSSIRIWFSSHFLMKMIWWQSLRILKHMECFQMKLFLHLVHQIRVLYLVLPCGTILQLSPYPTSWVCIFSDLKPIVPKPGLIWFFLQKHSVTMVAWKEMCGFLWGWTQCEYNPSAFLRLLPYPLASTVSPQPSRAPFCTLLLCSFCCCWSVVMQYNYWSLSCQTIDPWGCLFYPCDRCMIPANTYAPLSSRLFYES